MKNVVIVGCGTHMASGYACSGERNCLTAAASGEGSFREPCRVIAFISCQCPGRSVLCDIENAVKRSGVRPDALHLSSCLVHLIPKCPCAGPAQWAGMIQDRTGIPVIAGTLEGQSVRRLPGVGREAGERKTAQNKKHHTMMRAPLHAEDPDGLFWRPDAPEPLRVSHFRSTIILIPQHAAGRRLR